MRSTKICMWSFLIGCELWSHARFCDSHARFVSSHALFISSHARNYFSHAIYLFACNFFGCACVVCFFACAKKVTPSCPFAQDAHKVHFACEKSNFTCKIKMFACELCIFAYVQNNFAYAQQKHACAFLSICMRMILNSHASSYIRMRICNIRMRAILSACEF